MRGELLAERALAGGRRSVDGDDHESRRPGARISSAKPGKLVAMKAASSTADRLLAAEPHDQRRHRDAMVHVGRDHAAAGRAALAVHDQVVALDLDLDAVDAQHRGGGGEPVGFLDAQLLQAAHPRRALGERRGDREDRIFVDHGRRALGRHLDALAARRRARAGRRRPRRPRCASRASRSPRPSPCSVVSRPVRSGLIITPSRISSEPGTISAATSGNAADDGSAGTTTGAASSSGWPSSVMRRPCCAVRRRPARGAEMLEHPLGVVARRLLLDHGGLARRGQPGQQHRRLELRRRHRRLVFDRDRIARALQRRPAGGRRRSRFQRARAHRLQRIEHAPHRPLAQARVAVEGRRDRAAGDRAHHQPAAGAGIAEIERRRRLGKAADADAAHAPGAARRCAPRVAPSARMALAVLMTSSPSSRPVMRVSPTASAPRISARCEIDLSPGTRDAARQRPERRAVSGEGCRHGAWFIGGSVASGSDRAAGAVLARCALAAARRY